MTYSTTKKLRSFYSCFPNDAHVLILINADPDAIASAMAVKRLLWRKVASTTIASVNIVERPDNIALIQLLGVKLKPLNEIDTDRYSRVVIVDSQPSHHETFLKFRADVVIDHHPETGLKALYQDIRPRYGATASILTEYLRSAKIKPSAKLATGLFCAIKTDTSNFERKTLSEDLKAFQFLFRHANIHLARKIEQADLRLDFLKHFKDALLTMRINRSRIFVNLGPVGNGDVCVLIADFFMRVHSITWSIVAGSCENKLIIVFRNDGLRKDAGKVAAKAFGRLGSAGGHKSMARAEILLPDIRALVDHKDEKRMLSWIVGQIEKKAGRGIK
ncbi:MAG: DHH family phosphoesterase [Desulfobacterales bacterium]|nr:DHH family phosphoesterase [Desulfobacterales bacterium]